MNKILTPKSLQTLCSILFICGLVTACSHTVQRETCVQLDEEVSYCLAPIPLANSDDLWVHSATQKAEINVDTSQHELMTQLEIDANQLTLVGLAPLGQALFTLTFDGHTLNSEQSLLLGSEFKAEYLLALIQLIYWPEETVNAHLRGAKMISNHCADSHCRTLYATQALSSTTVDDHALNDSVLNIEYSHKSRWQAEVALDMPHANFSLKLTPI